MKINASQVLKSFKGEAYKMDEGDLTVGKAVATILFRSLRQER